MTTTMTGADATTGAGATTRAVLPLVRLLLRRHRGLLLGWGGLLVVLTGATTSGYQTTYTTIEQRRAAAELARHDAASTVMYGVLGGDQPAHMFVWEIGAFATVLAAVMGVVIAVATTRAGEEDGTVELVRGSGAPPAAPLRAALMVLAVVGGAVGLGCAVAVGLSAGRVDGITGTGAGLFGAVVGSTFLMVGCLTVVVAQVTPSATSARTLGFAVLAGAFVLRAVADVRGLPWLNGLSVLGLRALAQPFEGDRWWAIAAALAVTVGLGMLAGWLAARREHSAGLVAARDRRVPRRAIGSGLALTARLVRAPAARWTIAVACLGTAFATMGSGVVEQARNDDVGGLLGDQVGAQDPVGGFLGYIGTLVAIAVCVFAALTVLAVRRDETDGVTDLVLTTGARRWAPLAWRVAVTWGASLVVLLAAGTLAALVVPLSLGGDRVASQAFAASLGQWPEAVALTGWGALVAGRWPRATWLVWVPLVLSAGLVLLGGLLGVTEGVRDLGLFGHVSDLTDPTADLVPLACLVALGVVSAGLGAWSTTRRDIGA